MTNKHSPGGCGVKLGLVYAAIPRLSLGHADVI